MKYCSHFLLSTFFLLVMPSEWPWHDSHLAAFDFVNQEKFVFKVWKFKFLAEKDKTICLAYCSFSCYGTLVIPFWHGKLNNCFISIPLSSNNFLSGFLKYNFLSWKRKCILWCPGVSSLIEPDETSFRNSSQSNSLWNASFYQVFVSDTYMAY